MEMVNSEIVMGMVLCPSEKREGPWKLELFNLPRARDHCASFEL